MTGCWRGHPRSRPALAPPVLAPPVLVQDGPPASAPPAPAAPAAAAPAAGPQPAAASGALPARDLPVVTVKTRPDDVTGKSGEIVFTVELSRPIDDLLVLIYSTVDGGAHAGTDYTALQGILTLPAGAVRSEIRTAVAAGDHGGDKDFSLFVAANPDLATVAQPWTEVTIHADD